MIEAIKYVCFEHNTNLYRIWKIGKSHMAKQTVRTSLGIGWVFIRDLIYFAVFIAFRYFMSGSSEIEGIHFIVYLIIGIIPWFFMNEVLNGGANAIRMNKALIHSIKFPITIIPTIEVVAIFLKRLFTLIVGYVVCLMFGHGTDIHLGLLLYYFCCMFILMVFLNLIISALTAISQDFYQLYLSIVRVLFFMMPIIWSFENIGNYPWIIKLIKLNPMVYILSGFREAYANPQPLNVEYTLYFWGVNGLIFSVGCFIQYKLRRYYSDFV